MPPKADAGKAKVHSRSSQTCLSSQSNSVETQEEAEFSQLSVYDIISRIEERNRDPLVAALVRALALKIPQELSRQVEEEQRQRTIVISGIEEAAGDLRPSEHQLDVEEKVTDRRNGYNFCLNNSSP
ncbi:hypothetical protein OESDEN_07680 [Oesophagostomum dentatum]|uniref:Uncharacterized protein n=1 Tax=Oesophagostomum dentatum TaxID=61180 RepID=A0A0B1T9E0_OESDE|nr:hypothetical protein OESDEN_07680 [Oesophagostomum dentatum]